MPHGAEAAERYALHDYFGDRGMPVDANTLYPLLGRLEKQQRVSEWNTGDHRITRGRTTILSSAAGGFTAIAWSCRRAAPQQ